MELFPLTGSLEEVHGKAQFRLAMLLGFLFQFERDRRSPNKVASCGSLWIHHSSHFDRGFDSRSREKSVQASKERGCFAVWQH
jgi:hypothetical protein